MLTTVANVQQIPRLKSMDPLWVENLVIQMDQAIKTYCKRDLEKTIYTEYYNGEEQTDLVLRQYPVWNTGLAVYVDQNGYAGQSPGAFPVTSQIVQGANYMLVLDSGGLVSNRGILKRIGGGNAGFIGWYPDQWAMVGKLAAYRLPRWPRGIGNIKVVYTAGYDTSATPTGPPLPVDLVYACNMLVAWAVRNLPLGSVINNEGLGGYNYGAQAYSALGTVPELGALARTLAPYRESSWGNQ